MTTIRVIGEIDETHRLTATVPDGVPAGRVEVVVVVPGDAFDQAEGAGSRASRTEWHHDLADPRQDIYDLGDGKPADAAG